MNKGRIYAANFEGIGNTDIALYQLIIRWGTSEKITENNRMIFSGFDSSFRGLKEVYFQDQNWNNQASTPGIFYGLGAEGDRTIIRTTAGKDYPIVIPRLEDLARVGGLQLIVGEEAKLTLSKILPAMIRSGFESTEFYEALK